MKLYMKVSPSACWMWAHNLSSSSSSSPSSSSSNRHSTVRTPWRAKWHKWWKRSIDTGGCCFKLTHSGWNHALAPSLRTLCFFIWRDPFPIISCHQHFKWATNRILKCCSTMRDNDSSFQPVAAVSNRLHSLPRRLLLFSFPFLSHNVWLITQSPS